MTTTQPIQFDDVANKQGICQDIDFICGTDSTKFPKADKVRLVNMGLDSAADFIQDVNQEWYFDDSTLSTSPIGYIDTVANTQTVAVDTTWLAVRGVYVNNGNEEYTQMEEATEQEILETKYTNTGTPTKFRLIGNKIFLTPIPSSTTTGNASSKLGYALKVQFERNLTYFASDATTATVPYNPRFTKLAVLYACRDYAMAKGKENLNVILSLIQKLELSIQGAYARRNMTQKTSFVPMVENNK